MMSKEIILSKINDTESHFTSDMSWLCSEHQLFTSSAVPSLLARILTESPRTASREIDISLTTYTC